MSQYLLLRDNKQSGPYTFEELTAKGLKAYDLIWIEGKSAAWRYPSEITEFKPFAPVVEEQPYDRFYKRTSTNINKQAESNYTNNTSVTAAAGSSRQPETASTAGPDMQPVKKNINTPSTHRRVVVILPGGMKENSNEKVVFHETVENKIAQPERRINNREPVNDSQPPARQSNNPALVDFKRETGSEADMRRNAKPLHKSRTPKIIASTLVLLTLGVLIGWAFNNTLTERNIVTTPVTPKETVQIPEAQSVFNNENSQTVENTTPPADNSLTDAAMLPQENQGSVDSAAIAVPVENAVVKKPVTRPKKPVMPQDPPAVIPAVQTIDNISTETVAAKTDNDEAEKKSAKKNMNELIKISKNNFKIGAFGGISNLQLKVTNNSSYPVDLVVVEVKYLLANKKEFKTENVYFKNVAPGATVTEEAPKSSRGIDVTSKLALITSKALGMYQASL